MAKHIGIFTTIGAIFHSLNTIKKRQTLSPTYQNKHYKFTISIVSIILTILIIITINKIAYYFVRTNKSHFEIMIDTLEIKKSPIAFRQPQIASIVALYQKQRWLVGADPCVCPNSLLV